MSCIFAGHKASLTQLVEYLICTEEVVSSSLTGCSILILLYGEMVSQLTVNQ